MADDMYQKREAVKKVYPGRRWARRVDAMSDANVIALFMKFQQQKKI